MRFLEGKPIADNIMKRLEKEIQRAISNRDLVSYWLATMLRRISMLRSRSSAAQRIGIRVEKRFFLENTPQVEIEQAIDVFNSDQLLHGILVQVPLPKHLDTDAIINRMNLDKDVDGFHPENERRF